MRSSAERDHLERRLRLYFVADPEVSTRDIRADVESAIAGGVTCVQLRAKRLMDRELYELARDLRAICARSDALFLVNDRVDVALATGAHGVHLGVDDLPLAVVRSLGGPEFLIGYSPESDDQARGAEEKGADYLGIGPVFGTASKADAGPAIGPAGLARRMTSVSLPAVGIGGIDASNCAQVIDAGAAGVAVVSAVLRAPSPETAARSLRATVERALEARWAVAQSRA